MNRWSRLAIIFIAYALALLHTAVPHHHDAVSNDQTTTISRSGCVFEGSIGALLQMVFATDLGVGHLEAFKKGSDADLDLAALASPFVDTSARSFGVFPMSTDRAEVVASYCEKLHKRLLLFSSGHLRAPPVVA